MVFAVKNMLILEVVVLSQDVKFIANYFFFNTCQINLFTKNPNFELFCFASAFRLRTFELNPIGKINETHLARVQYNFLQFNCDQLLF